MLALPAGVWLGAATHVLLDEFTHRGEWAHRNLSWFSTEHWGLEGVK